MRGRPLGMRTFLAPGISVCELSVRSFRVKTPLLSIYELGSVQFTDDSAASWRFDALIDAALV